MSKQYINDPFPLDGKIDHGERIVAMLARLYGGTWTENFLKEVAVRQTGSQPGLHDTDGPPVPRGFWPRYISSEMGQVYSDRVKMRLRRSLVLYARRKYKGADTRAGLRGMRSGASKRSSGSAENATKALGLHFMLLQFFVDCVQKLRCRTDSLMLMDKARQLRRDLLHDFSGRWAESDLPKLIGNAGAKWFGRWRQRYSISKKVIGMKLKVAWRKIKKRVVVLLTNFFRLRFFWQICHGDAPMRWLSIDQKPSWFNNAGHTGTFGRKGGEAPTVRENFQQTRERYTILTSVPSGWPMDDQSGWGEPQTPKVAILFKGQPRGTIWKRLNAMKGKKRWMKIQTQEEGSYRSKDVVEALDWMLPQAHSSKDSIIVILDWFSGHLTEEVAAKVKELGHVLLFHGGGTTPFTQINDTHLHALLASALLKIENIFAKQLREDMMADGNKKTPSKKHEDIVHVVQNTWENLDHFKIQEMGYRQTGPTMSLHEPVAPEDVFKDLLKVLEAVYPVGAAEDDPIGRLRSDALKYVKEGYENGWWTTWDDHYKLIEEHDSEDEGLEEGLEAFGALPYGDGYDDDEAPQDDLDDDDGDHGDGDGKGGGADDEASSPNCDDNGDCKGIDEDDESNGTGEDDSKSECTGEVADEDHQDSNDEHGSEDEDGAPSPDDDQAPSLDSIKTTSAHEAEVLKAKQLLFDEAVRNKDDVLVRFYRKQLRTTFRESRERGTEAALFLRERAIQDLQEMRKRRKIEAAEAKAAVQEEEEQKTAQIKQRALEEEKQRQRLAQQLENSKWRCDQEQQLRRDYQYKKWVQTYFAAKLAETCMEAHRSMSVHGRHALELEIQSALDRKEFHSPVWIADLWKNEFKWTPKWVEWKCQVEKTKHWVRCSQPFLQVVTRLDTKMVKNPPSMIFKLLQKSLPLAHQIFCGALSPDILLQSNDYCMEKAYVYAIYQVSKKLGPKHFPNGIYKWPPPEPPDLMFDETPRLTI